MANELTSPLASHLTWKFKPSNRVGITHFDARKFAMAANSFQDPYPSGQEVNRPQLGSYSLITVYWQIFNRCQYRRQLEGEVDNDAFVIEERRRRDRFLELQTDDRLWANMIWASYNLKLMDHEKVNDRVLMDLLKAGVYDFTS